MHTLDSGFEELVLDWVLGVGLSVDIERLEGEEDGERIWGKERNGERVVSKRVLLNEP